eukprot:scaffold175075_cov20-Prasinocladus_malaysianus.AAC.1
MVSHVGADEQSHGLHALHIMELAFGCSFRPIVFNDYKLLLTSIRLQYCRYTKPFGVTQTGRAATCHVKHAAEDDS